MKSCRYLETHKSGSQRTRFTPLDEFINEHINTGLFPGSALAVLKNKTKIIQRAWGKLTYVPWSPSVTTDKTFFDLASLTKPLATACSLVYLAASRRLHPDNTLHDLISDVPDDKANITIRQLLSHSSGLPAHRPFYTEWSARHEGCMPGTEEITGRILSEPLVCRPGTKAIYSDPGYMLLGCIIERVTGMDLYDYVKKSVLIPFNADNICNAAETASLSTHEHVAPSGMCPRERRMVWGSVNDLNARSMGGFAGHAGLFGTAESVLDMLEKLLEIYHGNVKIQGFPARILNMFWTRDCTVKESTWALGFDTPTPHGSSAGHRFSPSSLGHLGFTGTSFWIDPVRKIIIVFLSNRVFPAATQKNQDAMRRFRPRLHNMIMMSIPDETT